MQRSRPSLVISTGQHGRLGIWDSTLSISNIAMATSATNFSALIHEKGVTEAALRTEPDSCGKLYREYVPSLDRKSTRLNSSHANISYAVFCLKKKKKIKKK